MPLLAALPESISEVVCDWTLSYFHCCQLFILRLSASNLLRSYICGGEGKKFLSTRSFIQKAWSWFICVLRTVLGAGAGNQKKTYLFSLRMCYGAGAQFTESCTFTIEVLWQSAVKTGKSDWLGENSHVYCWLQDDGKPVEWHVLSARGTCEDGNEHI